MVATPQQAVREMHTVFKTVWDAYGYGSAPFYNAFYENVDCGVRSSAEEPWAKVYVRHLTGGAVTISGGNGSHVERALGLYTIQLFQPAGAGIDYTQIRALMAAFRGVTTASGVIFRNVKPNEVGLDGDFYQTNIIANFEYDEVI